MSEPKQSQIKKTEELIMRKTEYLIEDAVGGKDGDVGYGGDFANEGDVRNEAGVGNEFSVGNESTFGNEEFDSMTADNAIIDNFITQRRSLRQETIPCPKCGHPTSVFYFTSVFDVNRNKITPRCQNCGYYEDPE